MVGKERVFENLILQDNDPDSEQNNSSETLRKST